MGRISKLAASFPFDSNTITYRASDRFLELGAFVSLVNSVVSKVGSFCLVLT